MIPDNAASALEFHAGRAWSAAEIKAHLEANPVVAADLYALGLPAIVGPWQETVAGGVGRQWVAPFPGPRGNPDGEACIVKPLSEVWEWAVFTPAHNERGYGDPEDEGACATKERAVELAEARMRALGWLLA